MPRVGAVLHLGPRDWLYQDRPLVLRVTAVRVDLSRWYNGDFVWCEGQEINETGAIVGYLQALVRVDAIPDHDVAGQ